MGKLLCDSSTVAVAEAFQNSSSPWKDQKSTPPSPPPPPPTATTTTALDAIQAVDLVDQWDSVHGLEDQQRRHLQRLHAKGVLWKHPQDGSSASVVFRLSHGGEVSSDGNCLFTASQKAMGFAEGEVVEEDEEARGEDARELRRRTVRRFVEDFGSAKAEEKESIEVAIKHMYAPDLKSGWGIHVVQEVKLLANKQDRLSLDSAIDELVQLGMQRYSSLFLLFLFFKS